MTQEEFDMLTKQYFQNRVPNYQLNTPSLSPNNMAGIDSGSSIMTNIPKTATNSGWDPWSVGLTALHTAAPFGASLLGRSPMPRGFDNAPSLGMTRGVEVPNVYAGRKPAILKALLAQYLRR